MNQTADRPINEIVQSIMLLVKDGRVKGQLARDLEKLCFAAMAQSAPQEPPK